MIESRVVEDTSQNQFLLNRVGKQNIIFFGDSKYSEKVCVDVIKLSKEILFKYVDPFGEIFTNGIAGTNYDVYDPDLLDEHSVVYISDCQSNDVSQIFKIMRYSSGVMTYINAKTFEEAFQCLLLRANFEDPTKSKMEWRKEVAELKPLFVHLHGGNYGTVLKDIIEYSGEIRHIHPI